MKPWRAPLVLRAYRYAPHRAFDAVVGWLAARQRPRVAVRWAIRAWVRRGRLDLRDFVAEDHASLQAFFLRRLRDGVRPLGDGVVAPVDGVVVDAGRIVGGAPLTIKGQRLSLPRLLGDRALAARLEGGRHLTLFLTPDGYHRVHAPCAARLREVRFVDGRAFPQNADALRHIPRIYERNARAVLTFDTDAGWPLVLVMVGASLVSQIRVDARVGERVDKGSEIGHFELGSTVVMLAPRGIVGADAEPRGGERVQMGQTVWADG